MRRLVVAFALVMAPLAHSLEALLARQSWAGAEVRAGASVDAAGPPASIRAYEKVLALARPVGTAVLLPQGVVLHICGLAAKMAAPR